MTQRRSLSQKKRAEICLRQNGLCAQCRIKLMPSMFDIDHVQALIHGGDNEDDNLRALCFDCHKTKTRKDVHGHAKADRIAAGGKQVKRPFQKPSPNWVKVSFGVYERRKE